MHCARKLIPCLLKHTWHDLDAWQIMLTSWVFNAADWTKQTCCSKSHKPYVSKKVESNNVYNLLIKSYFIYLPSYITFKTREKKNMKKSWSTIKLTYLFRYRYHPLSYSVCPESFLFTFDVMAAFLLSPKPHWATPFPRMRKAHHGGWSTLHGKFSRFPVTKQVAGTPCWRNHRFVEFFSPLN